nr:hypothetical protein CFP56_61659 [Quercus suber]
MSYTETQLGRSTVGNLPVVVDDDGDGGGEVKGGEVPRFEFRVTHEAKLKELLHKISSLEIKLCSDGLLDAWKLRRGRPGFSYIIKLISAILGHPDGVYDPKDGERIAISKVLNKFARLLVEEYMVELQKELDGIEVKCQNAALLLLALIVRRQSGLASEVGRPGLLRWVLQQNEMYSGVLRGLGNDDDETIIYVLSTLRDRVLVEESSVPPGLRSVLFGSVTLEQLVSISGRGNDGSAAELAYHTLVLVCTDPCNGLMQDLKRSPSPLRGNPKVLVGLMKRLKATEVSSHRDLLLAIVSGSPFFGSAYMEEFPYNLEDFSSSTCMRLLLEALKLLDSFISALNHSSYSSDQMRQGWASLKQDIQNEVRTSLLDPHVLLTLLSSLTCHPKTRESSLKRTADFEKLPEHSNNNIKKLKLNDENKDMDIVVSGIILI